LGRLLDSLCMGFTSRTRIPVALSVAGQDRLQPRVQEMLYRIAQEALNNISKHSAASAARIALTCSPEQVALVIADDGRGFDVANNLHNSLGIGIMYERAAKIGAQLKLESQLGAGTTITAIWREADS
jgi:signal transduction histidine kinase